MDLEAIYYIGQTVAVVAILGSLIAIYWQQRQANIMALTQNTELIGNAYADTLRSVMEHEDLAEIFRKTMFEDCELTPVEMTRITIYFNMMLGGHRNIWTASQNGLLPEQSLKDSDANLAWYLTRPVFLNEWKRVKAQGQYGGAFGDHIDRLIKTPATPMPAPEEETSA